MLEYVNQNNLPALLKGEGVPEYNAITPEQITENIPDLIKSLDKNFNELEKKLKQKLSNNETISWDQVMTPLHEIGERLRWSWGTVCHLNGVCNSIQLREAYATQQPKVVRFSNQIGQSQIIHKALCYLKEQLSDSLNHTQKRILDAELLSMHQRGVGLSNSLRKEFNSDSELMAQLSTSYSNNVLDATKEWSLLLTNKTDVDGLPDRALESMAAAAKEAGDLYSKENSEPTPQKGPWRLGLDMPSYITFITHSSNRQLRETVYRAYVSRASYNKLNNQPLIEEILTIRSRQAKRLGYANWAELSLASKMARNIDNVENLLEELRGAALPVAQKELSDLKACAKKHRAPEGSDLAPWDISFWAEKLKQERFDINQEELRPWFPFSQVLNGLFGVCEKLFDITIEAADGESPIWHEDVRFFKVRDSDGSPLAAFYLDPFSRPLTKRSGAWMDECLIKHTASNGEKVLPIAYLVCNQTPPVDEKPSLMSFEEVETLFHEFGHGLQHMLTTVDYPQAAGINNVEWDAVELPSQFMENWCLDRATLMGMAKHWKTCEPLPEPEFEKLKRSRTFNSGLGTLRQVHFALTDLRLHSQWDKDLGQTPDEMRREIALTTTVIPPITEDQFLCAFSHIFAGGYAAGYYSYKWAEVLSADAFSAFEEAGLSQKEKVRSIGKLFRDTVLSLGGSRSPEEVFMSFRGRPAKTDALIRHSGLAMSD